MERLDYRVASASSQANRIFQSGAPVWANVFFIIKKRGGRGEVEELRLGRKTEAPDEKGHAGFVAGQMERGF